VNWYKKAQLKISVKKFKFYHTTIPSFAEEIISSGYIKPSSQLPESYKGWYFYAPTLGHEYGDAIFLSSGEEKNLAVFYAKERLSKIWEEQENLNDLYDEDMQFIALFTIYIQVNNKKLKVAKGDPGEYHYFGTISNNPKDSAYWTGPQWISIEKELQNFINKKEKFIREMNP
jgi:hypothetical protein